MESAPIVQELGALFEVERYYDEADETCENADELKRSPADGNRLVSGCKEDEEGDVRGWVSASSLSGNEEAGALCLQQQSSPVLEPEKMRDPVKKI